MLSCVCTRVTLLMTIRNAQWTMSSLYSLRFSLHIFPILYILYFLYILYILLISYILNILYSYICVFTTSPPLSESTNKLNLIGTFVNSVHPFPDTDICIKLLLSIKKIYSISEYVPPLPAPPYLSSPPCSSCVVCTCI